MERRGKEEQKGRRGMLARYQQRGKEERRIRKGSRLITEEGKRNKISEWDVEMRKR